MATFYFNGSNNNNSEEWSSVWTFAVATWDSSILPEIIYDGDYISFDGQVFEFDNDNSVSGTNIPVIIGNSLNTTRANLATAIQNNTNFNVNLNINNGNLSLVAKTPGFASNIPGCVYTWDPNNRPEGFSVPAGADFSGGSNGNWYGDIGLTIYITTLPGSGDNVIATSSISTNTGSTPVVANFHMADTYGTSYLNMPISVATTGTFLFDGAVYNNTSISGNITFDNSYNTGSVNGNVIFSNYSSNDAAGFVGDHATFNISTNNGTVGDYVTFSNSSNNSAMGLVGDHATFNSSDNNGNVGDHATFDSSDNNGNVGDHATFDSSDNNGTVGNYATFVNSSANKDIVYSFANFNSGSYNDIQGSVGDGTQFHGNSYNKGVFGTIVLNDSSYNEGSGGYATFNDNSFNNGGTYAHSIIFNDNSYSITSINLTSNLTISGKPIKFLNSFTNNNTLPIFVRAGLGVNGSNILGII